MTNNSQNLNISWQTIFKIVFLFLLLYFFYLIREILVWFFLALIIAILLNPIIDFFERKKIPRSISTIFVYFFIFSLISYIIYAVFPIFITEIQSFSQNFPNFSQKFFAFFQKLNISSFLDTIKGSLDTFLKNLFSISKNVIILISKIFGGFFSAITIFFLALIMSFRKYIIEDSIRYFLPKKYQEDILNLYNLYKEKVIGWFWVRIGSCFFVAVFVFIILKFFNIDYAFSLSAFSGLFEILPIIGPVISAIILVIIALLKTSLIKAILVLVFFVIIQQIESNILTPILGKKFVKLPPILVIFSVLVGAKLFGILGAILFIPFFGLIYEILKGFFYKKNYV